jgi:type IV pilus assembly protein PilC
MPLFTYTGTTKSGTPAKGQITAETQKEATELLHRQHLIVTDIKTKNELHLIPSFGNKVPFKEKIIFTRQLAVMIKSGLPVVEALTALQEQTDSKNLSKIIGNVVQDIKGGTNLSQALAKFPTVFPPIYTNVVKSGEQSGKLEEVLLNMSDQLEKDYDLVARAKGAMIYPAIILTALIGVMFFISFFIIPQLNEVFSEMGGELPITTKILLKTSMALRQYAVFVFIGLSILAFILRRYIKTPSGQLVYDQIKLKAPVFGLLMKKLYMARFSRTMAMLISAGLPMLEVIKTSGEVINNAVYKKSFQTMADQVENGIQLSKILNEDKNFPPMVHHMISIGEQSGKLDYVLDQLATFFEKEVDNTTRNLSSMIEPLLMVVMGFGVGFVVISVMGPITNLANSL